VEVVDRVERLLRVGRGHNFTTTSLRLSDPYQHLNFDDVLNAHHPSSGTSLNFVVANFSSTVPEPELQQDNATLHTTQEQRYKG